MSGDEDFLSRWSRRKRAATEPMVPSDDTADAPAVSAPSGEVSATPDETGAASETSEKEEFDLASLPPIDSIVEGTDISGFLKREVPLDLTRAALRRAWSTDPAIRDFIGLAENAWDFNDPNAMPGFGPLDQSPEEVRRMLAQVMGEIQAGAEDVMSSDDVVLAAEPENDSAKDSNAIDGADDSAARMSGTDDAKPQFNRSERVAGPTQIDIAAQYPEDDSAGFVPRRTHGGALPR